MRRSTRQAPAVPTVPFSVSVVGDDLPPALLAAVRRMVWAAFGDGGFAEEDWQHTFGGRRVLALDGEVPVGHAAVVPRLLQVGGRPVRTGYVEGVATAPDRHGTGVGSSVMTAAADIVRADYEMGALSTSRQTFYGRLGWERWLGATYVRDGANLVRTAEEDDGVMVLRHGVSADVDLTADLSCEARTGDDW